MIHNQFSHIKASIGDVIRAHWHCNIQFGELILPSDG